MQWYTSVYRWRSGASTVWLLMVFVPLLLLYQMCNHCRLSPTWTALHTVSLTIIQLSYMWSTQVQVVVDKTRFHKIWKIVRPAHWMHVMLHVVMATVMSLCLSHGSNRNIVCWHGACLGLFYGVDFYNNNRYVLQFPAIQQRKLFRIKSSLTSHMADGAWFIVMYWRYFIPCYVALGWLFPLSYTSLLDKWVLWQLFSSGTLICWSWRMGLKLFNVFHTEMLHFPVVGTFADETLRVLTVAVKSKNMLLKYLAYLDLYDLSLHCYGRRQQVYSLTSDGRPLVWSQLYTECTTNINVLMDKLQYKKDDITDEEMAAILLLSQESSASKVPRSRGWPEAFSDITGDITRRRVVAERAKLWSNGYPTTAGNVQEAVPCHVSSKQSNSNINKKLWQLPQIIKDYLKKKPFFSFFLTELPGVVEEDIFVDYQLYIWVVTALTQLIKYSYREDQYGIVQPNLTSTIELLLKAYQLLDKTAHRNVLVSSKRHGVKTAIQCGLAVLHETFKEEMKFLQLPADKVAQLNKLV